ncbi:hypothetical protein FRC08_011892 [Ceratobasidium sp. 394]|nr:hypothetical protein FRC08_011892 [Ceratobasidium sp. 394]
MDEKALRERFTEDVPPEWVKTAVRALAEGLDLQPFVLREGGDTRCPEDIPTIVEAVVQEIARQHGVALHACAAWKESGGTMVTTQASSLPDPRRNSRTTKFDVLRHHAHFALTNGGFSGGPAAEDSYPVPWPDFAMGARPALPPQHPDWRQEKENLIDWFDKLWKWQGGEESPNWEAIVEDIRNGHFQYVEAKRLPKEYTESGKAPAICTPESWNMPMTGVWSGHVRSTMDIWGRVSPTKTGAAFQFRKIDDREDEDDIIHDTFMLAAHPDSDLDWPLTSLLFERRIRRAMATPSAAGKARAAALYNQGGDLFARAVENVPNLEVLRDRLCDYERQLPPEAEPVSIKEIESTWHPAAARVFRDPATFAQNWDPSEVEYPPEFSSRLVTGHHRWGVTALRDWLSSKPFWDQQGHYLQSGMSGVVVAFWTIVQYAENVAMVIPADDSAAKHLHELDLAVYGRADYRILGRCADILIQQIGQCSAELFRSLPQVDTDLEKRHAAWRLTRWVECSSNGLDHDLLANGSFPPPPLNVFEESYRQVANAQVTGVGGQEPLTITTSRTDQPAIASSDQGRAGHISPERQEMVADTPLNKKALATSTPLAQAKLRRGTEGTLPVATSGKPPQAAAPGRAEATPKKAAVVARNLVESGTAATPNVLPTEQSVSRPGAEDRLREFARAN